MPEERPHLLAVAEPPTQSPRRAAKGSGRLAAALAVLALLCAIGWIFAARDSRRLETELAGARSELADAQATLAAIESQRAEARAQLQALAAEANVVTELIRGLEKLLATDPAGADDAQPMRNEAEPRD
jgi:septal ring factor EnvC (AmiA/AmiB activator)